MTTTLMECGPGDSIQTLDGTRYIDDGLGRVEIATAHLREALAAGWKIIDGPTGYTGPASIATAAGPDVKDEDVGFGPYEGPSAAPAETGPASEIPVETEAEPTQRPRRQQK